MGSKGYIVQAPEQARVKAQALPIIDTPTPPTTPNATSISVHGLLSEIRSIHKKLISLPTLAPDEQINALLTRLVSLCIAPYSPEVTDYFLAIEGVETLCRSLRSLCAAAEGELEKNWARRILKSSETIEATDLAKTRMLLNSFPYYSNYIDLSRLECSILSAFLPSNAPLHNIAFIGSGPLPLSSFCLLDAYPSSTIHNVDRDAQALQMSKDLTARLGLEARMKFTCEDVSVDTGEHKTSMNDWRGCQVVFLAALVGMCTEEKFSILSSLARKLAPGTLVVARSARGMRSVLYPVLELSADLQRIGYEILVEVHPWTSVVNSVVVLRVLGR